MKISLSFLLIIIISIPLIGQNKVNPIIADYGGIFEIPNAEMKPDPNIKYNIVIDVATGSTNPSQLNDGLNNVARLLNLHAVGGVPKENLHVVLAIHGGATYSTLNNDQYQSKYGVDNPNLNILQALNDSGVVDLFICGQSMIARRVDPTKISSFVKPATSMLTTVTTYQLKGYAMLKFE